MSTTHPESTESPAELAQGTAAPFRVRQTRDGRRRSLMWVWYALLSTLCTIALLSHPGTLGFWVAETVLILYTRYLYRGGRWVFLFWIF